MSGSEPLSLIFYRGSGFPALMVRYCCRFPCQPFSSVAGHTAVRIGDDVYEAVISGVQKMSYARASGRADLIRECALPERTPEQIQEARAYAEKCVVDGTAYSWNDIRLVLWAWAAPWAVEAFPKRFEKSKNGTICSLFGMLVAEHAGCKMSRFLSPSTTPNELMIRIEDFAAGILADNDSMELLAVSLKNL